MYGHKSNTATDGLSLQNFTPEARNWASLQPPRRCQQNAQSERASAQILHSWKTRSSTHQAWPYCPHPGTWIKNVATSYLHQISSSAVQRGASWRNSFSFQSKSPLVHRETPPLNTPLDPLSLQSLEETTPPPVAPPIVSEPAEIQPSMPPGLPEAQPALPIDLPLVSLPPVRRSTKQHRPPAHLKRLCHVMIIQTFFILIFVMGKMWLYRLLCVCTCDVS